MLILAIGNPVYDRIQTPQIRRQDRVLSGCSTNACLAASKLGMPSALVGRLGEDFQVQFSADMNRYGIDYTVYPCPETGGFGLIYDAKGDRTLDILGVAEPIVKFPDKVREADFVLVGSILGETPLELIRQVADATRAPMILDPQGNLRRIRNGRVERYRNPEIDQVLPLFDVVKANEYEAEIITGIEPRANPGDSASRLFQLMQAADRRPYHRPVAIITLAEAGSLIFDGNELIKIPAYTTNAVDPTGAGDTYAGGFMVQYLKTPGDLRRTGCFASATASVMVENSGPDFPLTLAEATRRTEQLLVLGV